MNYSSLALVGVGVALAASLLYLGYMATGTTKECREFRRFWKLKKQKSRKSGDKYKGTTAGPFLGDGQAPGLDGQNGQTSSSRKGDSGNEVALPRSPRGSLL